MKPRVKYADFALPDFDAMTEETELLLDGEPCFYAGHHYDSIVWLKVRGRVFWFRPEKLRGRLKAGAVGRWTNPIS